MNSTLLQVEWEACPLEPGRDNALEAFARREYGSVPPNVRYLAHCPWVVRVSALLNPDRALLIELDFELADLVSMVVSQENSCRFCFAISHFLLRVQGLSEARIAELQARLSGGQLEPKAAAAVAFARRMSRSQPLVGDGERRALEAAGFGPGAVREIAFVVAFLSFANRLNTFPAIPSAEIEQFPGRWMFRLMRPLIARSMSAHRRRGQVSPAATPREGFLAGLVNGYAGSPIGPAIAASLDEAWASPVLSRRCKALLFAVVATGLNCDASLDDSRAVLRAEGLPDAAVDRALTHLQAPELDEVENLLLPFARDTIWYQPAPVQRRARELLQRLSPAQFVEAVGVLSLANALCRLTPAVVPRS